MNLAKQQRGLSFISVMILLILVGFVAVFVIKLVPAYIENFNVRSVLQGFKTDPATYANAYTVQDALKKRFDINGIRAVNASDVTVEPAAGGGFDLHVEYEVQVPFIANVTLLVKFSEDGQARGGSESP